MSSLNVNSTRASVVDEPELIVQIHSPSVRPGTYPLSDWKPSSPSPSPSPTYRQSTRLLSPPDKRLAAMVTARADVSSAI
jgi:hypothetical protein